MELLLVSCVRNSAWSPPPQLPLLLLRPAAVLRPGQRGSPAPGLPAHAGALWDVPRDRHAHGDVCPGNHHAGAPRQRCELVHGSAGTPTLGSCGTSGLPKPPLQTEHTSPKGGLLCVRRRLGGFKGATPGLKNSALCL